MSGLLELEHGVEDDDELSHDGGDDNLEGLALRRAANARRRGLCRMATTAAM